MPTSGKKKHYQNERENLGFESGDESEYLILPLHHIFLHIVQ